VLIDLGMVTPAAQAKPAATTYTPPPPPPAPPPPKAAPPAASPVSDKAVSADTFEKSEPLKAQSGIADKMRPAIAKVNVSVADKQMKAGDYDGAIKTAEMLKTPETKDLKVYPEGGPSSEMVSSPTSETMIKKDRFDITYGQVGDAKIAQAQQLKDMEKTMGRKIDPHNVKDVQDYFQKVSDNNPGKEGVAKVRDEYSRYATNFTTHPGSVRFNDTIPMNDRPGKFGEILANQPSDKAGRKFLDCKSYTYMNEAVLGNIKDKSGKPRFDVVHAGNEKHVVSGIFDKKSGEGFVMNNHRADPVNTKLAQDNPARADEMRVRIMKNWAPPPQTDDPQAMPPEPMSVAGRKPSDSMHPSVKAN